MLSPASHRVCCLAVMAPALTKAVKQTDCLPVVLSKTFCDTETTDSLNGENRKGPTLLQLQAKPGVTNGRRRSFMTRNSRSILKNGFLKSFYYYSLVNGQTRAKLRDKTWHGTILSTVPDNLPLRNTMNSNDTSLKNMGLAKANTSLSFQDQKKMDRINSMPHLGKESNSQIPPTLSESLPDLPDSTNSEIQSVLTIMPVVDSNGDETQEGCESVTSTSTNTLCSVSCDNDPLPVSALEHNMSPITDVPCDTQSTVMQRLTPVPNGGNAISSDEGVSLSDSCNVCLTAAISNGESLESPLRTDINQLSETDESQPLISEIVSPQILTDGDVTSVSDDYMYLLLSESKCIGYSQHLNDELSQPTSSAEVQSDVRSCVGGGDVNNILQIPFDELVTLNDRYKLNQESYKELVRHLQHLQIKDLNSHIKTQLQHFVGYYQKHLSIPCQRQTQYSPIKRSKESVDLKAELLQSENVRNLSTAALVSFVRELESSGSPDKYLPQPKNLPHVGEASTSSEKVTFDPEDCADIKHTSRSLLKKIKPLLVATDPDITESSSDEETETADEFTENEEGEELNKEACAIQKRALWKWEIDRAAIARRWTWLLMQIHDVMYRRMQISKLLKQARSAKGELCFEDPIVSETCALSSSGSDNASLQTSPKQTALKSIIKPVNGYLDHNTVNDTVPLVQTASNSQLDTNAESSCSRTRPLKVSSFRKRKLLRTTGLHLTNSKAARLSTLSCNCNCQSVVDPCTLCGGRYNNVQSVDPDSMSLLERIALLDPSFHPVLSYETEVPQTLHLENLLKENEAHYQALKAVSPVEKKSRFGSKPKHFSNIRNKNRKLNQYTTALLSAKYRTKHLQKSKQLQKRGLFFGKWRKLKNKSTLRARSRIRKLSVASSASSRDSQIPSPPSALEDGFHDQAKRRRDDFQFDIDDVILPCNTKIVRTENWQYKEIEIPSWRYMEMDHISTIEESDDVEDISEAVIAERHAQLEIEEKKLGRGITSALLFGKSRRGRRQCRADSQADSSGANTPDPLLLYQQDIVFQDPSPMVTGEPTSPVFTPPATPSSAPVVSDDSQPPLNNMASVRFDKKRVAVIKRPTEDSIRTSYCDNVYVPPYERLVYPLGDQDYDELLKQSTHLNDDPEEIPNGPACPQSPDTSSSSTSTADAEEEDITDPEWTVVKREAGPEQTLIMKLARR